MTQPAVIASEPQGERGNPKGKDNAKFMDCHAVFKKNGSQWRTFLVILSVSEVSINLRCVLKFFGFFAFLQKAQNDKVPNSAQKNPNPQAHPKKFHPKPPNSPKKIFAKTQNKI